MTGPVGKGNSRVKPRRSRTRSFARSLIKSASPASSGTSDSICSLCSDYCLCGTPPSSGSSVRNLENYSPGGYDDHDPFINNGNRHSINTN